MFIQKSLSLVERKKQQWAREKEELSRLKAPWDRDFKNHFRNSNSHLLSSEVPRRSSLPPINQSSVSPYEENERDFGGETSGYGSDNPNYTPKWKEQNSNPWDSRSDLKMFWETSEEIHKIKDAPGWVKRGLERNAALVVANSSPSESPEQYFDQDRPTTSSSISRPNRTFIRGQNVPLDPDEVVKREQKRQMALAHQEAIKQQLEENERKKKEEKQRAIDEERREEMRLEKERQIERERVEKEQKILKEKQEKEQKRKEALKQALELAQKQAEEIRKEKSRKEVVIEQNKDTLEDLKNSSKESNDEKSLLKATVENSKELPKNPDNNTPKSVTETQGSNEILPAMFQTPEGLNSLNFAVLMNNVNGGTCFLPIAIPINTEEKCQTPKLTINRVLTPSSYRIKKFCNSSTQTDHSFLYDRRKKCQKKMVMLDIQENRRGSRAGTSDTSDRPKWGANRPHTRYMKQSEKDIFYQRRKIRSRKSHEIKINSYSPRSSEDSETANVDSNCESRSNRRRALWRKNKQNPLQTQIIPLKTYDNQIYYELPKCEKCQCKCHDNFDNNADNYTKNNDYINENLSQTFQNQLSFREESDSLSVSNSNENNSNKDSSL